MNKQKSLIHLKNTNTINIKKMAGRHEPYKYTLGPKASKAIFQLAHLDFCKSI